MTAVTLVIALIIDLNVLGSPRVAALDAGSQAMLGEGPWRAVAYILGAVGSASAGLVGMSLAVRGNMRTATAASEASIGRCGWPSRRAA